MEVDGEVEGLAGPVGEGVRMMITRESISASKSPDQGRASWR